jgi:hypothetical protein
LRKGGGGLRSDIGFSSLALILFLAATIVTVLLPARWRWIVAAGIVGALAWWVRLVAEGCDKESEVRCGWQPVVGGLSTSFLLAAWLAGVGAALVIRRSLTRRTG